MVTIKKQDFVQIEYTGKIKVDDVIFDTTNESIAKEKGIHNPNMPYGKYIICVGEGQILSGLDEELIGKEVGKDYSVQLSAEKAFGKKDAKLLKLVPTRIFKKQGIQVQPGLQLNMDGTIGTIRTVTGGRTVVDFNHPLSGKEVVYDFKISKVLTDDKEKVESYLKMTLNTTKVKVDIKNGNVKIDLAQELPEDAKKMLGERIQSLLGVKGVKIAKSAEDSTTPEA